MAKTDPTAWNVLPHGKLEQLSDNLFRVWGSLPKMSLKRTMTIVRMRDGGLLLHSALAMDETEMRALEQLGTPRYLIVPNEGHRLDAPAYKKRYPALRVFGPMGGRAKIAEAVPLDGTYETFPFDDDTVRFEMLQGVNDGEGAMIVRSSDGMTVVLNDVVMNMDRKRDPLGFFFTTIMGSAGGPRVSRFVKMLWVKDQGALRADLERLAELPGLVRLIVSHEKVASGPDAANALRRAATYLRR